MTIEITKKDHVTTVCIKRADRRNAIDPTTATELADAFREFERDSNAHVAVLCGEGGNFCAGADLKAIAEGDYHRIEPQGDGPLGPTRMVLSKPVIAALSGYTVAGGLELALWCDLRIMEKNGTLGFFERRWGVPLIDGGTVRLPRLIGLSRALDLIITGREVAADEALSIGLVHRLVPPGTARHEAEKMAGEIAAFPQHCLRGDRLSAIEQDNLSFEDAIRNELKHGMNALQHETREGAKRFADGAGRHGQK